MYAAAMDAKNIIATITQNRNRLTQLEGQFENMSRENDETVEIIYNKIKQIEARTAAETKTTTNVVQVAEDISSRIMNHWHNNLEPLALSDISRAHTKRLRGVPVEHVLKKYLPEFYTVETYKKKRLVFPPGEFEKLSEPLQEHWREFGMTDGEIKKSQEQRERTAKLYAEGDSQSAVDLQTALDQNNAE